MGESSQQMSQHCQSPRYEREYSVLEELQKLSEGIYIISLKNNSIYYTKINI